MTTGCMRNDFPTIYGDKILLSTNCKIASAIPALMNKLVDTVAAIINVGIAPKIGPKYGIISVTPTTIPRSNGYFIPINQNARADTPPKTKQTNNCPRI